MSSFTGNVRQPTVNNGGTISGNLTVTGYEKINRGLITDGYVINSGLSTAFSQNLVSNSTFNGWATEDKLAGDWTGVLANNWASTEPWLMYHDGSTKPAWNNYSLLLGTGTHAYAGAASPILPIDPSIPYTLVYYTTNDTTTTGHKLMIRYYDEDENDISSNLLNPPIVTNNNSPVATFAWDVPLASYINGADYIAATPGTFDKLTYVFRFDTNVSFIKIAFVTSPTDPSPDDWWFYIQGVGFYQGCAPFGTEYCYIKPIYDCGNQEIFGKLAFDIPTQEVYDGWDLKPGINWINLESYPSPATFYLPKILDGKRVTVKNFSNKTYKISIHPQTGEMIEGSVDPFIIQNPWQCVTFVGISGNSLGWVIESDRRPTGPILKAIILDAYGGTDILAKDDVSQIITISGVGKDSNTIIGGTFIGKASEEPRFLVATPEFVNSSSPSYGEFGISTNSTEWMINSGFNEEFHLIIQIARFTEIMSLP